MNAPYLRVATWLPQNCMSLRLRVQRPPLLILARHLSLSSGILRCDFFSSFLSCPVSSVVDADNCSFSGRYFSFRCLCDSFSPSATANSRDSSWSRTVRRINASTCSLMSESVGSVMLCSPISIMVRKILSILYIWVMAHRL